MECSWDALVRSLPTFHGVGWAEEQGKRSEMEDGTVVIRDFGGMPGAWLLAIYDGHGGRATVSLLLQRLHSNLLQQLQERATTRWESLKRQAQRRRRELTDLLELQQKRNQALRLGGPRRRQQRLRVTTQGGTHLHTQAERDAVVQKSETEACEHSMREPQAPLLEVGSRRHRMQGRIDAYWRLIRTHQLLHVLHWLEERPADLGPDARGEASSCVTPHCLLVCTEEDVQAALSDAFRNTDEELLQEGILQSGATACVALLRPYIDFQRLLIMEPEDFTDQDWLLFSGNNISFPSEGKTRGEREFVGYGEGRPRSPVVCFGSASKASEAEAAVASTADGGVASSSEAERKPNLTEADVPPGPRQHREVFRVSSGSVPPAESASMHHVVKDARKAEETRAPTFLLSIKLSVAHLGDSRALLVALDGSCERLTAATDHKASSFQEVLRVEEAGGWVFGERVNGMLAIGRAFGDWCLKLDPKDLKVFSGAAVKEIDAQRTEDCDERKNRGKTGTGSGVAADCKSPFVQKATLQVLPEGLRGLSTTPRSPSTSAFRGGEEGAVANEETGEAVERRLTLNHSRSNKTPVRARRWPLTQKKLFSRKYALIVSNEPHICTKDLLAFQDGGWSKGSAAEATSGSDEESGSEVSATVTSDTFNAQPFPGCSSVDSGGLTSPPVLLLLGCDGLFDVCSDYAVTAIALDFLRELQEAHSDLTPADAAEAVARALIEEAIAFRESTDNVSVTVALLLPLTFCGGEGVFKG